MPVQRTVFGRPITLRIPPRRFQILLGLISLFILSLVFFGPKSVETVSGIKDEIAEHVPDKVKIIGQPAHKPPEQANSTSGAASWYNDWKWRNPFSSTITLDENRAVLPPLQKRPHVYTYYEPSDKKDKAATEAEEKLILIWRRAWWAQGFKPVVLGSPEAIHNPLYESLQPVKEVDPALKNELMRWLAWGNMGSGILANWLALPMDAYENDLLSFLRRGEFPQLSGFKMLGNGLFYGEKEAINDAIMDAIGNLNRKKADESLPESIWEALDDGKLQDEDAGLKRNDESKANSIAYYPREVIDASYTLVSEKINAQKAEGLNLLALLINGHLHTTWQNIFPNGVEVLKPLPQHMTALLEPAVDIARNLTQCPLSPLPASCPPNRPRCTPCDSSRPHNLSIVTNFRNTTDHYTIGTVPHPYTFTSLHYQRDTITRRFLRRETTTRDPWIQAVTKELVASKDVSASARVVHFKDAVASPHGSAYSLWLTAERESHVDLDWIFGFSIPRGDVETVSDPFLPVRPLRPPPPTSADAPAPNEAELAKEKEYLGKARQAIKSEVRQQKEVVMMVEAWNLADTEAWRFARAFSARRRVERQKWEQEEKKFAGAEEKREGWGRWFDRRWFEKK